MKFTIVKQVLDYIQADVRTRQGGNAFASGWAGVTREKFGIQEKQDWINIFDRAYAKDSKVARPAIYVGTAGSRMIDSEEFKAMSHNGVRVERRVIVLPLYMICQGPTEYAATDQVEQLRQNIKLVMADHTLDQYWYSLNMPGQAGGGELQEREWASGSGSGPTSYYEANIVLPLRIRYQWSKLTTNA